MLPNLSNEIYRKKFTGSLTLVDYLLKCFL